MSEADRDRRLSVQGRLADLRAKHGTDIEDLPLPPWLESLEGALESRRRADDQRGAETPVRRNGDGIPPIPVVPTAPVVRPPLAPHDEVIRIDL